MKKRDKILYWVATIWLSLGMVSTGVIQILQIEDEVERMNTLGYPANFLTLIGSWKLLGVVAVLIPKYPLIKEWAYAGFFFLTTGAMYTHFMAGDPAIEYFGPTLLLLLTIVSWYYRPEQRSMVKREAAV